MMPVRRFAGTTWLAATVALLLPAMAWLQYDWVNQLAAADRDRRERTLRAAGAQFTAAVNTEVSRLGAALQLDGAMVERRDWDAYALRYAGATDGDAGTLVAQVWFVDVDPRAASPEARLVLHVWRPEKRTFEVTSWPPALDNVHTQLLTEPGRRDRNGDGRDERGERPDRPGPRELFAAASALGDERTLVMPIVRLQMPRGHEARGDADGENRFRPDLLMRGFTIVRLNLDRLAQDRLPALAAEHFPEDAEYRVAVVTTRDGQTLFESTPGAAADTATDPDLTTPFMQARIGPMMFVTRLGDDGDRRGDRTLRARTMMHPHGHWTLRVKHAAGSLEAAVAASRRRNLALSSGVLALLGVVVALIAVSARRAQALARRQMEFVAAVSHELRTPVAVINSAAGNLADGVVGDPQRVRKYGQTIQTEARRLGDTVERVLQLAGLGSGHPLPMHPVAADAVVHDAVRSTEGDARDAGVTVRVDVAPDLPAIVGDAGTLQAAVQNLVGNAIKYVGDDRWVGVTVTAASAPRREMRIAVEDHGAGLDDGEQRLVFEPFFRGRRAVADQITGSGLGLSLVRRIAEAHGGRVELVSSPGHGSTFTICLPAAADTPLTASAAAQSPHVAVTEA